MTAPLFATGDLVELRALNAASLVHACDVYVPTAAREAGGLTTLTYPPLGSPTAAAVPCRYVPERPAPERLAAGAVAAPAPAVVIVAAGEDRLTNDARLRLYGESAGVAFERWLAVQGAPEPEAFEIRRRVRVAPSVAVP